MRAPLALPSGRRAPGLMQRLTVTGHWGWRTQRTLRPIPPGHSVAISHRRPPRRRTDVRRPRRSTASRSPRMAASLATAARRPPCRMFSEKLPGERRGLPGDRLSGRGALAVHGALGEPVVLVDDAGRGEEDRLRGRIAAEALT